MKIPYRKEGVAYDSANYFYIIGFIIFGILSLVYQEFQFFLILIIIPLMVKLTDFFLVDGRLEITQRGNKWLLINHKGSSLEELIIKKIQFSWHYEFVEMEAGMSGTGETTHTNSTNLLLTLELENGQNIAILQNLWPWQVEPSGWPYAVYMEDNYTQNLRIKSGLPKLAKQLAVIKAV